MQTGGELIRVYGGAFGDRAAAELEGMIALGEERTFDQDPGFALRMMVDIATRLLPIQGNWRAGRGGSRGVDPQRRVVDLPVSSRAFAGR